MISCPLLNCLCHSVGLQFSDTPGGHLVMCQASPLTWTVKDGSSTVPVQRVRKWEVVLRRCIYRDNSCFNFVDYVCVAVLIHCVIYGVGPS